MEWESANLYPARITVLITWLWPPLSLLLVLPIYFLFFIFIHLHSASSSYPYYHQHQFQLHEFTLRDQTTSACHLSINKPLPYPHPPPYTFIEHQRFVIQLFSKLHQTLHNNHVTSRPFIQPLTRPRRRCRSDRFSRPTSLLPPRRPGEVRCSSSQMGSPLDSRLRTYDSTTWERSCQSGPENTEGCQGRRASFEESRTVSSCIHSMLLVSNVD